MSTKKSLVSPRSKSFCNHDGRQAPAMFLNARGQGKVPAPWFSILPVLLCLLRMGFSYQLKSPLSQRLRATSALAKETQALIQEVSMPTNLSDAHQKACQVPSLGHVSFALRRSPKVTLMHPRYHNLSWCLDRRPRAASMLRYVAS